VLLPSFLAIAGLAIDNDENYKWVKTIYIDDPISSLDDNNVIIVASYLAKLIKDSKGKNPRDIFISSTFSLFPSFVISREKLTFFVFKSILKSKSTYRFNNSLTEG
jgi:wobble nucleotide-excising tRNase